MWVTGTGVIPSNQVIAKGRKGPPTGALDVMKTVRYIRSAEELLDMAPCRDTTEEEDKERLPMGAILDMDMDYRDDAVSLENAGEYRLHYTVGMRDIIREMAGRLGFEVK